ncbi:unnamed protein product, partial [Mesorhabditis belari]|uniref:RNase H type-1 domain-containing protein n=1 Tax=Mesorhabditis belari TaxID=2138241 RepID=A0AAF3E8J4_9BILA
MPYNIIRHIRFEVCLDCGADIVREHLSTLTDLYFTTVVIYTDASCRDTPSQYDAIAAYFGTGHPLTQGQPVRVFTDSQHTTDGLDLIYQSYNNLRQNPLTSLLGAPTRYPYPYTLMSLYLLLNQMPGVTVSWCRSHSGIPGNEIVEQTIWLGMRRTKAMIMGLSPSTGLKEQEKMTKKLEDGGVSGNGRLKEIGEDWFLFLKGFARKGNKTRLFWRLANVYFPSRAPFLKPTFLMLDEPANQTPILGLLGGNINRFLV